MAAPWTQGLSIRWRPALQFYEQRIVILRALEDQGVLKAFAVTEDSVGARLLEPGHELAIRRDGLDLNFAGGDAERELLWPIVVAAVAKLGPVEMRTARMSAQYIVPLDMSFEAAVQTGRSRFLALPAVEDLAYVDFALVADLSYPDGVKGQIEFGIIRAAEAPMRLARAVGRSAYEGHRSDPQQWIGTKFPPVAMFADVAAVRAPGGGGGLDELSELWATTRARAQELVAQLWSKIDG